MVLHEPRYLVHRFDNNKTSEQANSHLLSEWFAGFKYGVNPFAQAEPGKVDNSSAKQFGEMCGEFVDVAAMMGGFWAVRRGFEMKASAWSERAAMLANRSSVDATAQKTNPLAFFRSANADPLSEYITRSRIGVPDIGELSAPPSEYIHGISGRVEHIGGTGAAAPYAAGMRKIVRSADIRAVDFTKLRSLQLHDIEEIPRDK